MANIHIDMNETEETDTAIHCNILQRTATHYSTLQHTATHCSTLQRTTTHCSTLQRTATRCTILQHCGAPLKQLTRTRRRKRRFRGSTGKQNDVICPRGICMSECLIQMCGHELFIYRRYMSQRYLRVRMPHSNVWTRLNHIQTSFVPAVSKCGHDPFTFVDMTHSHIGIICHKGICVLI